MNASESIIVALDTDTATAHSLAQQVAGKASWLKVGMTLFYRAGPGIVSTLKDRGFKIFVDLKLHDIPHQVHGAAKAVVEAGADMLSIHASGGEEMMRAACKGAQEGFKARQEKSKNDIHRPLCLAITVLTSLDSATLQTLGISTKAHEQVLHLTKLAQKAGMDGIVCSPEEIAEIRACCGSKITIVTPGIRPKGSAQGDQVRVATPRDARVAGADYLVIGRPITEAEDPGCAFDQIVSTL